MIVKYFSFLTFVCILIVSISGYSQELTPQNIIEKSILYHDPSKKLLDHTVSMHFIETRPKGPDRSTSILVDIRNEVFQVERTSEEKKIKQQLIKGKSKHFLDGSSNFSDEEAKDHRLNENRIHLLKNYYEYLWLLPHKLEDPGTILDPEVKKVDFFGKNLWQIKVSYSPDVGKDLWYFYFHPETFALSGYRFYHDESKNDGEYILLEGSTKSNGVNIPKSRTWYTHKEDKLLGTDILDRLLIGDK